MKVSRNRKLAEKLEDLTAHENSFIRQVSCGGNTISARLSYQILNSDWLIKSKMCSLILLQIALKKDKEIYRAFWLNFLARQLGSSIACLFVVTDYRNLRSHIFLVFIYVLMATTVLFQTHPNSSLIWLGY